MKPAFVYRIFDEYDSLIYVGSTVDPVARRKAHDRTQPWADQIVRWENTGPMRVDLARAIEREVILIEQPRHNVHHTGRRRPRPARASDNETVLLSTRLPRDLYEHLREMAKREHRTVAGQLRHIIAQHVNEAAAA